jgi:hypothetical protein
MNGTVSTSSHANGPLVVDNFFDFNMARTLYSSYLANEFKSVISSFSWDSLPSSNKFGIIQFFAELDDTLAMFTTKFWKELSYGSFTWGVQPVISDIQNISKTAANMLNAKGPHANSWRFESSDTYKASRSIQGAFPASEIELTIHRQGFVFPPELEGLGALVTALDAAGFHPDLATVWDLVPLSFVVDYFLPVGKLVDSIHSRGWVRAVSFTGWTSVKVKLSYSMWSGTNQSQHVITDPRTVYSYYARWFERNVLELPSRPIPDYQIKPPSVTQLFNTLYILLGKRK